MYKVIGDGKRKEEEEEALSLVYQSYCTHSTHGADGRKRQ